MLKLIPRSHFDSMGMTIYTQQLTLGFHKSDSLIEGNIVTYWSHEADDSLLQETRKDVISSLSSALNSIAINWDKDCGRARFLWATWSSDRLSPACFITVCSTTIGTNWCCHHCRWRSLLQSTPTPLPGNLKGNGSPTILGTSWSYSWPEDRFHLYSCHGQCQSRSQTLRL